MNQDYRGRVKRHLEAGGDPKYVNVKAKSKARHEALEKAKGGKQHTPKKEANASEWVKSNRYHNNNVRFGDPR